VIAAMLRDPNLPGNVQKILADSLSSAPTLRNADLQMTDLHDAYLGDRIRKVDVSGADFFGANLSKASLAGATARQTVFYRADLRKAKLPRADLRAADFREATLEQTDFSGADLLDARFDDAKLEGAVFRGAKNVPSTILEKLDANGVYA
jgi:uncharacterized protein YjbI with pentapeptide repeats